MTQDTTDTLLSFVTTPAGMDPDEFQKWIETVHFRELVDYVDGIVSLKRFDIVAAIPPGSESNVQPFLAVYTLDKPVLEVLKNMGEVVAAGKLSDLPGGWNPAPQVLAGSYRSTIS